MNAKRKCDAHPVKIEKHPRQEKPTLGLLLEQLEFDECRYDRAKLTSLVNMLANECLDIRQEFLLLGGLNKISKLLDDADSVHMAIRLFSSVFVTKDFERDFELNTPTFVKLTNCLHFDDAAIVGEVCRTLSQVSGHGWIQDSSVVDFSFAKRIVGLASHSSFHVQLPALEVIVNFFAYDDVWSTELFLKAGALNVMSKCLRHPADCIRDMVSLVLDCEGISVQAAIDVGIVLEWADLHITDKVKKWTLSTACALNNIIDRSNRDQAREMLDHGCLDALLHILHEWKEKEYVDAILIPLHTFLQKLQPVDTLNTLMKYDGEETLKELCSSAIEKISKCSKQILKECYPPTVLSKAPRVIVTLSVNESKDEVTVINLNGTILHAFASEFGCCTFHQITFKNLRRHVADAFRCEPGLLVFVTTSGAYIGQKSDWLRQPVVKSLNDYDCGTEASGT